MTKKRLLITGATGLTGGHALTQLDTADFEVRALVRRQDQRSKALEERGVEICVGDITNMADVQRALTDVDRAYFVYPIRPGLVSATVQFAQFAREAGVSYIVNMSQISARPDATSRAARAHWLAERALDWCGVPVTHLSPTFFADWMTRTAPMLARGDTVYLPFDGGRHAPISGLDQGRVIAALMKSPHQHAGQTYKLTGTAEVTPAEMVDQLGHHIGRSLTFQPVPATVFCDPIKQQISRAFSDPADPGLVERLADIDYLAQHLGEVAKDYAVGSFSGMDTSVADITGTPAQTLAEFYSDNDAVFRASKPVGSAAI